MIDNVQNRGATFGVFFYISVYRYTWCSWACPTIHVGIYSINKSVSDGIYKPSGTDCYSLHLNPMQRNKELIKIPAFIEVELT